MMSIWTALWSKPAKDRENDAVFIIFTKIGGSIYYRQVV